MTSIREFEISVKMNRIGSLGVSPRGSLNYYHQGNRHDLTKHVMLVDNKRMQNLVRKWYVADGRAFLTCLTGYQDEATSDQCYLLYPRHYIGLVLDLVSDLTAPVAIELTRLVWNKVTQTYDQFLGEYDETAGHVKSTIFFVNECDAVQFCLRWAGR